MYRLRFDVETISKATRAKSYRYNWRLRFDVETINEITCRLVGIFL